MLQHETWPIDKLIEYARNPRKNDHAVDRVAAAIREFGFRVPVVAKSDGTVVDGHLRLKAAKKLGLTEVPVVLADDMTDLQIKAFRLSVNKMAELAEWDDELLAIEFAELADAGFDNLLTGFTQDEIDALTPEQIPEGLTDEDAVPEVQAEPVSKLGDVWLLGKHRVMCGDSTSIDAFEKLMDGAKADMVFTDPPYGFNYVKKSNGQFIKNDGIEFEQIISEALALVDVDTAYVCGDAKTAGAFLRATSCLGEPKTCIVWSKPIQHRMHRYEPCHEFVWYWGDNGSPFYGANVYEAKRAIEKYHPTVKPVDLVGYCISSHGDKMLVLDLFGGSGSTLIACEKTGRHARLMELDPKYVDVIVRRWQEFTGKQATHESTGATFAEVEADGALAVAEDV